MICKSTFQAAALLRSALQYLIYLRAYKVFFEVLIQYYNYTAEIKFGQFYTVLAMYLVTVVNFCVHNNKLHLKVLPIENVKCRITQSVSRRCNLVKFVKTDHYLKQGL